jgi:peroxiredoxin
LRSEAASLTDQGATILGIVGQDRSDLAEFVARTPLPFPLLSDESRSVIQAYGVFNPLNLDAFRIAHPSAFLIDPRGVIRWSYVAASQSDWPQTRLVAAELARLIAGAAATEDGPG